MTDVERAWFRRRIAAQDVGFLYSSETDPDGEFDHVGGPVSGTGLGRVRRNRVTGGRSRVPDPSLRVAAEDCV